MASLSNYTCKGSKLLPRKAKNSLKQKVYGEIKSVNLKPVKKIDFNFDPFNLKSLSLREFLFHLSGPKIFKTNRDIFFKVNVLSKNERPEIKFTFFNNYRLIFETENLSLFDLAHHFNKISIDLLKEMEN